MYRLKWRKGTHVVKNRETLGDLPLRRVNGAHHQ
jgi:hypothetical protein